MVNGVSASQENIHHSREYSSIEGQKKHKQLHLLATKHVFSINSNSFHESELQDADETQARMQIVKCAYGIYWLQMQMVCDVRGTPTLTAPSPHSTCLRN